MKTTLYLVRNGATDANLTQLQRLLGHRQDPPLSKLGIRQAELTRNLLGVRPIDGCYTSPLCRAKQTAGILAGSHGVDCEICPELVECNVGTWEGLDWQEIRYFHADSYRQLKESPQTFRFPGGEALAEVQRRITGILEHFLDQHPGQALLVVGHHLVQATYLAGLLGLSVYQALQVHQDNCGVSVVVRADGQTSVHTLNASFHLHGLAA